MYNKILTDKADICLCRLERDYIKREMIIEAKKSLDFSLIPNKVFSFKDLPKNFFQFTNDILWNKMIKKSIIFKNRLYFQDLERYNNFFFIYSCLIASERITVINKVLYKQRIRDDIQFDSFLYKRPYCFLNAFSKLYNWLVYKGIYSNLSHSFTKMFIKLSYDNLKIYKDHKDIYYKFFSNVKEKYKFYNVEKSLDKFNSNLIKKANTFLFSDEKQEYENMHKDDNNQIINIAMATNNDFIFPTIVSLTSMIENANKNTFYKYTLLVPDDFLEDNKKKDIKITNKISR